MNDHRVGSSGGTHASIVSGTAPATQGSAPYRFPATLKPDTFALDGAWTADPEALTDAIVKRVGIAEWADGHLVRQSGRSRADQDNVILSGKSGARQYEKLRQIAHPIGASRAPALAMFAITVQRDGAADRVIRAEPILPLFDPEFLVEESPPDHDGFASQLGIDFVDDAGHRQPTVNADGAP